MQPVIPRISSGRRDFSPARVPARPNTRSSAFSRTAQVLIRIRSAAAGSSVRPYPAPRNTPSMVSLSATFIWQP